MSRHAALTAALAAAPLLANGTATPAGTASQNDLAAIWEQWIAMWNGDLAMADLLMAPDYVLHMSPVGGKDLSVYAGPKGMADWIAQLHQAIDPFVFDVQVQPLFGNNMIAGRWLARGSYKGGFPGAKAAPGTPITFAGADFLRVENGKIAEYWLSSDQLELVKQLGFWG
jgi:predicted ester cyclase